MNPPLRQQSDIDALLRGIADGTITFTVLATDHAPHTRDEKELEFAAAPYGIVGLDCALPLYIKALIDGDVIGWPRLVELLTVNPAELCGLTGKGRLQPGGDADVTVIDPGLAWTVDTNDFASKARNCPFDGWPVKGRAVATIVAGRPLLCREPERLRGWPHDVPRDAAGLRAVAERESHESTDLTAGSRPSGAA